MRQLQILIFSVLIGCDNKQQSEELASKILETDSVYIDSNKAKQTEISAIETNLNDWQSGFGLKHDISIDSIWFKPVKYYFEDPNCDSTAKEFYWGKYRPTDDEKTDKLLNLATTSNKKLRPLYRWILNKTISIQDGALSEHTGIPARKYAEKYPKEFFEYMDIDSTGEKYEDWINSISYSGFYNEENYDKPELVRNNLFKTMYNNCKNCDDLTLQRIKAFAKDCFPHSAEMSHE